MKRFHALQDQEVKSGKSDDGNWGCGCLLTIGLIALLLTPSEKKSSNDNTDNSENEVLASPTSSNPTLSSSQEWVNLNDVNGQTLDVLILGVRNNSVIIERRDHAIFTVLLSALTEDSKLKVLNKTGNKETQQSTPYTNSNSLNIEDTEHVWTDLQHVDGREIRAKILSLNESKALIKRDDGQEFEMSLDLLTPQSRAFLVSSFRRKLGVGETADFISARQLKYGGKIYTVSKIKLVSDSMIEITTPEGLLGMPLKVIPLEWLYKK